MKLSFWGAAREVTGSCHCIDVNGKKILIDCGLAQGADEQDNSIFSFNACEVDYVILTHAHIDHSGRLPLLVKYGFRGEIYATGATCNLLSVMLLDSAYIQEAEAKWKNRKGKRAGGVMEEPLYTVQDAENCLEYLVPCVYDKEVEIYEGITLKFRDAGHLLGSALAEILLTELGITKKIIFSGDIGNANQPIIRDPSYIKSADYVVTEATYGDRNHEPSQDYTAGLARIIDTTLRRGGNVIIPSFAVGRTQELLYFIREMKERELVKSIPDFSVYMDSPLALEATKIYDNYLTGYADEETIAILKKNINPIKFSNLHLCDTADESKAINDDMTPKVIISSSGMCEAGRIRHHLKHNLWRPECSIVFVGYQANGTLGRIILDGAARVKLFGEEIAVKAEIFNFMGLSAHADRDGLIKWISSFENKPAKVFVVHGEGEICDIYGQSLSSLGFSVFVPNFEASYDLAANSVISFGSMKEKIRPRKAKVSSSAYAKLLAAGQMLLDVIRDNEGLSNKDLAKFTNQITEIYNKWK